MSRLARTARLPDGRVVGYAEVGDPAGAPVVYCHGTPGSRLEALLLEAAALACGVRVVAPDRPGHGLSDPRAPWRVADWPPDAAALADRLDLERFALLGWSGGGPYALAAAQALGGRVTRASVVGGSAPAEAGTHGMAAADRAFEALARRSPAAAAALLAPLALASRRPALVRALYAGDLSPADRAALDRAPAAIRALAPLREAFRQGTRGVALDYRALAAPWGFALGDVAAPVTLWQGDADRVVPPAHAEHLAAGLPDARLERVAGLGHLLLVDRAAAVLGELLA